ncbi:hypothetical protein PR001_g32676 [Phytophthora rubi]|uniref:Uncharacterized protein n=1 Tax=Phytophthora rubi TaxID=129364 RepID=A0A6A3GBX8_9STRA|nr:hypothetical protein PR001_g32676 [Phytophthora rubi]
MEGETSKPDNGEQLVEPRMLVLSALLPYGDETRLAITCCLGSTETALGSHDGHRWRSMGNSSLPVESWKSIWERKAWNEYGLPRAPGSEVTEASLDGYTDGVDWDEDLPRQVNGGTPEWLAAPQEHRTITILGANSRPT